MILVRKSYQFFFSIILAKILVRIIFTRKFLQYSYKKYLSKICLTKILVRIRQDTY
jgi:hypothetical protein